MSAPIDLDKLSRVLQLSTSDNDNEALACIRAANAMLKARDLTWESLIRPSTRQTSNAPKQEHHPDPSVADWGSNDRPYARGPDSATKTEIETMFTAVLFSVTGGPRDFLESLHTQWKEKGWLSDKQIGALRKFYANATRRQAGYW
jgi:hypothetical protein